jgi:histidinol-phosphate aminotransferase
MRQGVLRPVYLDRNENRYGPAPACFEALRQIDSERLFRYTRDFEPGFTSALSVRLAALHGIAGQRIVFGYGAEDLLKQAIRHWIRPGDRCLVPSASWWYYRRVATEVGGLSVDYPLIEDGSTYRYDLPALERALSDEPSPVVLIASPNNPTGNRFPVAELPRLLDAYPDTVFVYDEAYWGFSETSEDAAALTARHANLLVLRTFSKLYALAGARIGYAIAGTGLDGFLTASRRLLGYNRVSEELALAALSSPDYYDRVRRNMIRDRQSLLEALRQRPDVQAYDSEANFVLARFPRELLLSLRPALEQHGLFLKFFDEPAFAGCVRITIGTAEDNVRLLAVVCEVLGTAPVVAELEQGRAAL